MIFLLFANGLCNIPKLLSELNVLCVTRIAFQFLNHAEHLFCFVLGTVLFLVLGCFDLLVVSSEFPTLVNADWTLRTMFSSLLLTARVDGTI